jgi:hypothetical protein
MNDKFPIKTNRENIRLIKQKLLLYINNSTVIPTINFKRV